MQSGRSTGLILMALAVAAFLGSSSEVLPPATFFPALALFAIGAVKFFTSSREAIAEADRRTQAMLHPVIRENRAAQATAERRAARRGAALTEMNATRPTGATAPSGHRAAPGTPARGTIEVEESEGNLVVLPDVSFPVEVQRGDALADQLRKLNQLLQQGVLTEEEYAIAKAKILA
jgi:hypothetical protein